MTKQEKIIVSEAVEAEGFDYTFMDYSDFREIKDEKFHELRENYMEAAEELAKYAIIELENED